MKLRISLIVLMLALWVNTAICAVVVPQTMSFAGMTLELTPAAREKIQKDVDMIMRNPTYFQQKVERANLYFPLVEKVFNAEGFPTDFKYLSLQESSLISDAVSTSNAVGFWQFKKESAIEVGVRVDGEVDERMNIVASSRGASKYLTRNNAYYKNWIYTLLSYNLGFTGAKSHAQDKYIGSNTMKIGEDMHWYVIRFLAHMLAYRDELGKTLHPQYRLEVYVKGGGKTITKIAQDHQLSTDEVLSYNKWALKGQVPSDREYYVILPVAHGKVLEDADKPPVVVHHPNKHHTSTPTGPSVVILPKNSKPVAVVGETSQIKIEDVSTGTILKLIKVNKVKAVVSRPGDQVASLAFATGITMEAFRHFNEMQKFDDVKPGKIYYLQLKRSKAIVNFHTVEPGETLWDIAQRYGVKSSSIINMNRMGKREALRPGRVLWMNKTRPKDVEVEYKALAVDPVVNTSIPEPVVKDTHKVVTSKPPVTPVVIEPEIVVNNKVKHHVVVQGETLYSISRTYQVPVDSIMKWNQLREYSLKTGQTLYVENPFETAPIEHVVQPGETMYAISKKYQVTIDQIKTWNHKTDNQLKPGEVIIIKKTQ
jgi:membrane-bound lytic murein transglycosylase D